jgi:drug/metabolite transporter (DMT)-like permease
VIVLILAFTLLGEAFSITKFLGAILMVAGALAISLDRSFTGFRDYFASNRAISLVLIFATSMAVMSVFYKHMMNAGASVITTYFFLKLFQCAASIAYGYRHRALKGSFAAIVDLQVFVQARAMQTVAAFLYLFVLRHVDLSAVEPIAAAIGPLLYLIIDKVFEWRAKAANASTVAQAGKRSKAEYIALLGSGAIAIGLYFVVKG